MFVRIASAKILPGKTEQVVDFMRDVICKNYENLPGIKGTTSLIDRENGKAVILIYGQTKDDCNQRLSHGAELDQLREVVDISTYEIISDQR